MRNHEWQVVSIELAKRMQELGFPQESLFGWRIRYVSDGDKDSWEVCITDGFVQDWEGVESWAAFTVAELGEMLPDGGLWLKDEIGTVRTFKAYRCEYCLGEEDIPAPMCKPLHRQCADTEADARAKMLIYLAENGLLDVKSLTNNKDHGTQH